MATFTEGLENMWGGLTGSVTGVLDQIGGTDPASRAQNQLTQAQAGYLNQLASGDQEPEKDNTKVIMMALGGTVLVVGSVIAIVLMNKKK